jgi:hypothetical protein
MGSNEVVRSIGRNEVEGLLLRASPSFEPSPDRLEYHEDYDGEEEPQLYLLASVFVRHLAALNAAGQRDEFPAVFDLVEDLHVRGDDYVRVLASIGFLEDLQNANLHPANSKPEDFIPYLRPVSLWWWEEVDLFWAGKVNPIGSSGRPYPAGMGLPRSLASPDTVEDHGR